MVDWALHVNVELFPAKKPAVATVALSTDQAPVTMLALSLLRTIVSLSVDSLHKMQLLQRNIENNSAHIAARASVRVPAEEDQGITLVS